MATISDVRDGLAVRLRTISGLHVYDEWPDTITPPAALIRPASAQYEQTFGADWATMQLEVLVVVGLMGGLANAERAMEPYISNTGTSSIRVAVAADRTLALSGTGTVRGTFVRGWRNYEPVAINELEYLGTVIDIECEMS